MIRILAIRVIDRIKESGHTQDVLTTHSKMIVSRLGFHELNEKICSREGYIVLHLKDDINGYEEFRSDLNRIYGIEIKDAILCDESGQLERVPDEARIAVAAVRIDNREATVKELQKILSLFGCTIRTRLGVNLQDESSDRGLILLELIGDNTEINRLLTRLFALEHSCTGLIWFE